MRIGIVGAGMAGLSCADALMALGHDIKLFDKGRAPGGRMATRRIETSVGTATFDHGAQYFTVRNPYFAEQVAHWSALGIVSEWSLPTGNVWVGTPTMNSIVKAMSAKHDIAWNCKVESIAQNRQGWVLNSAGIEFAGFDCVALAIPPEQATPFLALYDFEMVRRAMMALSQPCWTAMLAFAEPIPTELDILHSRNVIGWAARDSSKPGRNGLETWVVQGNATWSRDHIEDAAPVVAGALLDALASETDVSMPRNIAAAAHRWRYARSQGLGLGAMWNAGLGLGVCGDWLLGSRVECAWLSGQKLARQMHLTGRRNAG